ncbi:MAG TPA: ATP-dependent Clp protease proteolytic subunit [Acidimicrobiales bacterium]|jgi:ATP-dependent Clp protease protease subunit|nr:ATP-dependent Clp protease proteolytic subunit [Acidimicrobiales bacterium]
MIDWQESLRARMFDRRVILVSGALDQQVAGQAAMELMTLDASGDEPIHLQIDSPDGSLEATLSLMDVVQLAGVPVRGTGIGLVGGPAVGLLAVCAHRMATPHGRFRLAEPKDTFTGSAGQLARWAEDRGARWRLFCERLAAAVGRSADQVAGDLAAGRFLSAEEAAGYGLVDEICRPEAEIYRLPGRPIGFQPPR